MSHVDNGTHDGPRNHPDRQIERIEGEVPGVDDCEIAKPEQDLQHNGKRGEEGAILTSESYSLTQEYEGILPHPGQFNAYNANAQEALIEIARAQVKAAFEDESERQNRLVEAEIKQGNRGQVLSTVIILSTLGAAIAVAVTTGSAFVASLMVGIPLVSIIGNLFKPAKSHPVKPKGTKGE